MSATLRRKIPTIAASGVVALAVAATTVSGAGLAQASTKAAANETVSVSKKLTYKKIKEPFTTPVGTCDEDGTTVEMANCFLKKVVTTDKKIDKKQKARFDKAKTNAQRKKLLKNNADWLAGRTKKVSQINTGGSIDTILKAQETLKLSKKRLKALS